MKLIWHTEQRLVKDLIPYRLNPRKRNEQKQSELRDSLIAFNLVDTPVLNNDGVLISGERRLEALLELGRGDELIDVRVPNRLLSEEEVKRYCLLANSHAGDWDLPKLEAHFSGIYQDIIDLPSLDNKSLPSAEVLTQTQDASREIVEDDFIDQAPPTPITQLGDIYELNGHRLICGDSTDINVLGRLMAGNTADMIFTDPPYNLAPKTFSGFGKHASKGFVMGAGEMTSDQFSSFLQKVFNNMISYSRKGSIHYICMDWKHMTEILQAGSVYTTLKNLIVWNKNNGGMGTFYRSKHELIFMFNNDSYPISEQELHNRISTIEHSGYEAAHTLVFTFKNGKERNVNNFMLGQTGRYRTNVWDYPGANSLRNSDVSTADHPTPKPIRLVADAIMDCSLLDNIILDCFLGSGTTLMAAHQTQRRCFAVELDPAYCDLTIRRYARFLLHTSANISFSRNGNRITRKDLDAYGI